MKTGVCEHRGFQIEYFLNDDLAISSIAKGTDWEPHILRFMQAHGVSNVIDVGANFGYHTLFFARLASGNVYAFEPQQQNYELLRKNIAHNSVSNAVVYNLACGDTKETVRMPLITTTDMINMGDVTPNRTENAVESTEVDAVPLDSLDLPPIDCIKIDVQGYEVKVLNGARQLINQYKPTMIVEFEDHQMVKTQSSVEELIRCIREMGYYIFYLEYQYPSDHVCVHVDKLDSFRETFKDNIVPHTDDNRINKNIHFGINEKIRI